MKSIQQGLHLGDRGYLIYFGYWGRAAKKGIVLHDFGINMGLNVLRIGINKCRHFVSWAVRPCPQLRHVTPFTAALIDFVFW